MSGYDSWRRSQQLGLVVLLVTLSLTVVQSARADLIFLKDGFVIQGQVKGESESFFDKDARDMVTYHKGFYFIDDMARRIFFTPSLVSRLEKKPFGDLVRAVNKQEVAIFGAAEIKNYPVEQILETGDWNDKWERQISYRCPRGTVTVNQRLGFINSYYARLAATSKVGWFGFYMTSELGPEAVSKLLGSHPDFKETPDMKAAEKAARRFKYCDFFVQAGWFEEADRELSRMLTDLPDFKERIETTQAAIGQVRNRERFEAIKRQFQAGQFEAVRKRLAAFPDKDVPDRIRSDAASLNSDCAAADKKMAEVRKHFTELVELINDGNKQVFIDMVQDLKIEISPEGLGRLDAFLGQATQARRLREQMKKSVGASELLSLAVTGWLLGSPAAEAKPERAMQLWAARKLLIDYQREPNKDRRDTMLSTYLGRNNKVPLDEIVQMIPNLPPPQPEKELDTKVVEVAMGGEKSKEGYLLQLPPEYRHNRSYPVIILLHREDEKGKDMIERWTNVAADNGYILAAPRWEGGFNAGYKYSQREHKIVLGTLRDLRQRFNIDSDRVFLFGLGQGANMAFDVGLAYPDLFAGVIPMSGVPEYFSQHCWRNGQFLPFYIVTGSVSGEGEKNTRALMENWAIKRQYPMLWVQYKGRGGEWFGGELPNMIDWMRNKRRAYPLQKLGNKGLGNFSDGNEFCTMREGVNRFFWLAANGVNPRCLNNPASWNNRIEPAKMSGWIELQTNEVSLTSVGLQELSVSFGRNSRGESPIDFDKPVTIKVNNHARWNNQKIVPNLGVLLEELVQTGDRQRLVLARIDFSDRKVSAATGQARAFQPCGK